jgi:hypothetical protein
MSNPTPPDLDAAARIDLGRAEFPARALPELVAASA